MPLTAIGKAMRSGLTFKITGRLEFLEKSHDDQLCIQYSAKLGSLNIYKMRSPICPVNLQVRFLPVLKIDLVSNIELCSPLLLENINQTMGKNQIFNQLVWR